MQAWKFCFVVLVLTAACLSQQTQPTQANPTGYYEGDRGFTAHFGGGYAPLVGPISGSLENGWNVQAGGGYMFTPSFGIVADYHYFGLGVPDRVLNSLAVPDGNAWVHSITFGPEIRLAPDSTIDPYLIGEVGWYRRTVEFTRPSVAAVTVFDPFLGFFVPVLVPADTILGTRTRDGIGGNAGVGVAVRLKGGHAKVFAEARYHYASHERKDTQILPFTVGIRW
jgi:hypothetical protein